MGRVVASYPTSVWDGSTGNNWRSDRKDDVAPDLEDWDRISAEMIALQEAAGAGAETTGAKNGSALSAVESRLPVHRTVLTLAALNVDTIDHTTAGAQGSHKLYDFPAGIIQVLGCVTDLTIARVGTSIAAAAAVVASVGTAAAAIDNATLTGTEADIIPSTAAPLTAGAGTVKGKSTATEMAAGVWDGTSTAKDAYLNFAVPDADHGGTNDALTVSGTVTITWVNHGDN